MRRRHDRRRRRASSARRGAWLALATFLVFAGGGLLLPGDARAQCVQEDDTVTCSGNITDGFDTSDVDDLRVLVEPDAQVSITGDGVAALAVGHDSHVRNGLHLRPATITAGGDGSQLW